MDDFEQIYRTYAPAVKKYIMSLGADSNLSDDITAETFLKALKNLNSYNGDCKLLTWLCTIAKNTYFDHIRKKENNHLPLIDSESPIIEFSSSPQLETEEKEQKLIIYKNLMKLDYPYKDVIYFRIFADLSFREIGDILDKNENWARVTFYRGKAKLKELIDNEL